ncbi:MAG: hypothetical protein IKG42_02740 [Clostridia bacterium]|nr:hypothetical protein [Clostridia bacterium]
MKRYKKITMLILIFMIIISISNIVFGGWTEKIGTSGNKLTNSENIVKDKFGLAIGIVQIIGVGIAVIMLLTLGIKFMIASPNEKADIKKHAIIYVVGALIFFGASGLLELMKSVIESMPSE